MDVAISICRFKPNKHWQCTIDPLVPDINLRLMHSIVSCDDQHSSREKRDSNTLSALVMRGQPALKYRGIVLILCTDCHKLNTDHSTFSNGRRGLGSPHSYATAGPNWQADA